MENSKTRTSIIIDIAYLLLAALIILIILSLCGCATPDPNPPPIIYSGAGGGDIEDYGIAFVLLTLIGGALKWFGSVFFPTIVEKYGTIVEAIRENTEATKMATKENGKSIGYLSQVIFGMQKQLNVIALSNAGLDRTNMGVIEKSPNCKAALEMFSQVQSELERLEVAALK